MANSSETTATVYQLFRGNHRENMEARAAEDIRHETRCNDRDAIAEAELARFYEEVGEEIFSHDDVERILPRVWARWNRGSGEESVTFAKAKTRSLEVGDVVAIDGDAYLVAPVGWDEIEVGDGEAIETAA